MKKALLLTGIVFTLMSCGDSSNGTTSTDTLGTSPGAIDEETQHPSGVSNQNVISTDTSAMNVEKMSDTTGKQ
ncbi:hypothetical protein [Paracnuella aquatica]|uniref:hypothetical protein n=1 Tax=Paracnuella aquatica TaxID=2268757 RepID=UPI000DEF30A9|nr:hypothetical protein [Paracnuella aquatica]RPD48177.1 hypothetical protein DRJ53_10545 [Paracnuella aquatica]